MSEVATDRHPMRCSCGARYFGFSELVVTCKDGRVLGCPDGGVFTCLKCKSQWFARVGVVKPGEGKLVPLGDADALILAGQIAQDNLRNTDAPDSLPAHMARPEDQES